MSKRNDSKFLSSGLGAFKSRCLGLSVARLVGQWVRKKCQQLSKTLKQREFKVKLEIKDMIKVRLALNLFTNLMLSL